MTKTTHTAPSEATKAHDDPEANHTAETTAILASAPEIDLESGIKHLRSLDGGAMRIWTVKGPKEVGGTISGVLLNEPTRVVLLVQLPGGSFTVYERDLASAQ